MTAEAVALIIVALALVAELAHINWRLGRIEEKETRTMLNLDQVVADVQAQTTVVASVVTLLNSLSAQLQAAGQDPAKLAALDAAILANSKALSDAVLANTPAPPPAPPAA